MLLNQNFKQEKTKYYFLEIIREILKVSLITYFILYLIDFFNIGFVSNFFNFNILIWIIIITGLLNFILNHEINLPINKVIEKGEILIIIIFSVISSIIIYFNIKSIGSLSIIISILSGLIIFYISYLITINNFNEE